MTLMTQAPAGVLDRVGRARVRPGEIALWYLGGAGYVVKTPGATILVDPFIGPSNPPDWIRAIPPAFDPEDVRAVDAVFLTHEHSDHTDPVALGAIGRQTNAPVYGPASCIAVAEASNYPAERRHVLEPEGTVGIGDLRVTAVPLRDPGAKGCNGYIVEAADVVLLHCADSVYFPGFVELGRRWSIEAICISVAANPPGCAYYMDEVDAARAARDAGARVLIPQHFDLWQGLTLDPQRVATAARWYCPTTRVLPARYGERITIGRAGGGYSQSRARPRRASLVAHRLPHRLDND
jgi:L-ascorbate 6-phosphate lactonase